MHLPEIPRIAAASSICDDKIFLFGSYDSGVKSNTTNIQMFNIE